MTLDENGEGIGGQEWYTCADEGISIRFIVFHQLCE